MRAWMEDGCKKLQVHVPMICAVLIHKTYNELQTDLMQLVPYARRLNNKYKRAHTLFTLVALMVYNNNVVI